jgi:hypothetical protein
MERFPRRTFFGSMALGAAALCLDLPAGKPVSIRREVTFPREMTRAEYDRITAASHDYPQIQKFNARMKKNGYLTSTAIHFEKDRAFFDHTFADVDSYKFWLENIDMSWFDLERFENDGFRVKIYSVG